MTVLELLFNYSFIIFSDNTLDFVPCVPTDKQE